MWLVLILCSRLPRGRVRGVLPVRIGSFEGVTTSAALDDVDGVLDLVGVKSAYAVNVAAADDADDAADDDAADDDAADDDAGDTDTRCSFVCAFASALPRGPLSVRRATIDDEYENDEDDAAAEERKIVCNAAAHSHPLPSEVHAMADKSTTKSAIDNRASGSATQHCFMIAAKRPHVRSRL